MHCIDYNMLYYYVCLRPARGVRIWKPEGSTKATIVCVFCSEPMYAVATPMQLGRHYTMLYYTTSKFGGCKRQDSLSQAQPRTNGKYYDDDDDC